MAESFVRRRAAGRVGSVMIACVIAVGCGGDSTGPVTAVATTSVEVLDFAFSPRAIVVAPGATVTWTFTGGSTHSVEFASASITDSPDQSSGTFSTDMPSVAGTYSYACGLHASMTGSVQVQ